MSTPSLIVWIRLVAVALVVAGAAGLRAQEAPPKADLPPGVLKRFDKNKDGKLDEAERAKWEAEKAQRRAKDAARRAELIARFDVNKDGKIDANEGATAKLAMAAERTEADAAKIRARMEKEAAQRKADAEAEAELAAVTKPKAAAVTATVPGTDKPADSMMGESMSSPAPAAKEGEDTMMLKP
jgi:membrane protein involved in colicin uptake